MKKKQASKLFLLAIAALALAIAPATGAVWADTFGQSDRAAAWSGGVDISWYTETPNPQEETDFYIETPEQLAGLAYIVNGRLDAGQFPTVMKKNTEGKGAFNKTVEMEKYDPAQNTNVRTDYYIANKYGKGAFDYDAESHKYVAASGEGAFDKGSGVGRFYKPFKAGTGDYDYYEAGDLYVPNPGKGEYKLEVMTEYKFDRLDKDGNHNGNYDVDVAATVDEVIDGSEEDGTTASGLTAEDFFVAEPTHIVTSGGFGSADDYYYIGYQKYDFMGQTIHIMSDMDLGGRYYSYDDGSVLWYGPDWVPIGGNFIADKISSPDNQSAVDLVAVESSFNGTLDGGFHTISNMYLERWAGGNYMLCQGIGLVGQFGDLYDSKDAGYGHAEEAEETPEGWVPTIRNLAVGTGYVFSNRMVGGLVGCTGSVDEGVLIENCSNAARVKSTDAKGVGGIVGATMGTETISGKIGIIRNCYNTGNISASYDTCPAGGIVGSSALNIYNSYNRGQISAERVDYSEGIGSHYQGSYTVDNCYSLDSSYMDSGNKTTPGYYMGAAQNVICNTYARSASEMKSAAFLEEINGGGGEAFVSAGIGQNNGFPVLFWQKSGFDPSQTASLKITDGMASLGTVSAEIPRVQSGSAFTEKRTITSEDGTVTVPVGTIVSLRPNAKAPNMLKNFTARTGGSETADVRSNYYTLATPGTTAELDGVFITLQSGTLHIDGSSKCHEGISKSGVALDKNGQAWPVSNYTVTDGETVFQKDILSAKAVLKKGAAPKDKKKEFTGTMKYSFAYTDQNPATNRTGQFTVSEDISESTLKVSFEPELQDKNWITLADTSWCDAKNLQKKYTITTVAQLAGLAKLVNAGESFKGVTITLGKDINLKNSDGTSAIRYWTAIGNSKVFSGTFDGAGHMIKGMNAGTGTMSALFGKCDGATIKNLYVKGKAGRAGIVVNASPATIDNCVSYVTVNSTTAKAGGIAAVLSAKGYIKGCRNKGTIKGISKVGGIVGSAESTAKRIYLCANYKAVTATAADSNASTGGIAAELGCEVRGCANFGKVTSKNGYVGGIAGFTFANQKEDGNASAIYDSYNRAKVSCTNTSSAACSGGLVGYGQYLIMDNCYNTGSVALSYTGSRPHKGLIAGYFYKSAYNKIKHTYYNGTGNTVVIKDTKNAANDGRNITKQSPKLSYVTVTKKTTTAMKKKAFATTLTKQGKVAFKAITKAFPQLKWITQKKDFKVTYVGAYKGTDETYYKGSVQLPECSAAGYMYTFTKYKTTKAWTGTNITKDVKVTVKKAKITTAKVVFRANGKTLKSISFKSNAKYLTAEMPDAQTLAPAKEGYTVAWDENDLMDDAGLSYWDASRTTPLGVDNIIVNAVYSQKQLAFEKDDDGEGSIKFVAEINPSNVNEDHYYFLKPRAKGTITVKEGTQVTLDGSNGPFDNVRIIIEPGCDVTLKDLDITTDPALMAGKDQQHAVLEVTGGDSREAATILRASGDSALKSSNDGSNGKDNKNFFGTVSIDGYVVFEQAGSDHDSLHITAWQYSPEINILDGATLEVAGGVLEVYKLEKLGYKGGIIYGQGFDYTSKSGTGKNQLDEVQRGNLTLSGGQLISVSESNNVFAMCVNKYTQTGGCAQFYATEAGLAETGQGDNGTEVAIYASEIEITGGSLYAGARSHQNTSSDPVIKYNGKKAIRCGGSVEAGPASSDGVFESQYFMYKVDTKGWTSPHTISVDGKEFYRGLGNTVVYNIGDGDAFKVKKTEADSSFYLWLKKGSSHTIAVDGKTVAQDITEADEMDDNETGDE